MKLPKLKYYYLAMTSDAYIDFSVSRRVAVDAAYSIDLLTGSITGTTQLRLAVSAMTADADFRAQHCRYDQPVYVLRIPRELIDRSQLRPVSSDIYTYHHSIEIPHCGVERIEFDPQSRENLTKVIDTVELKHI